MSKRDLEKSLNTLRDELLRSKEYKRKFRQEGITETPVNDADQERLRQEIERLERATMTA